MSIRVGIVGAGGIARSHLRAFSDDLGLQAVAIADLNEESAQNCAAEFSIPHVYTDYRAILDRNDIDAVILCVPNFLHAPVAIESLRAGKHVLCEKPMAMGPEEANAMKKAAQQSNCIFALALNHRYRPEVQQLHKIIRDGKLGRIYYARTGLLRRAGIPGWGSWFTQKSLAGGGALNDIGVHMLDVTWYLAGSPRPLRVNGITYAELGPKRRGLGGWGRQDPDGIFDVEDLAVAMIRCEGGLTLLLETSWALHTAPRTWIELMGTEAGASVGKNEFQLHSEVNGEPIDETITVPGVGVRPEILRHFVACIRSGEQPISNAEEGVWLTKMLEGIYRSAALGREVEI